MKNEKTKRGGARKGAGRKAAGTVPVTLRLHETVAFELRDVATERDESMSDIAERGIVRELKKGKRP